MSSPTPIQLKPCTISASQVRYYGTHVVCDNMTALDADGEVIDMCGGSAAEEFDKVAREFADALVKLGYHVVEVKKHTRRATTDDYEAFDEANAQAQEPESEPETEADAPAPGPRR